MLAPAAYDGLTAWLVEQAGFEAVYMTGFGTSTSLLGRPDIGLLSFSEMVDNARRTIKEYKAAGVAGIHIEDQMSPKKCGHLEGKEVIEASEMGEKVRAAVEARSSEDFVIIGRTDARAVNALDGALERARRYREAGADVLLFVEAPQSEEEVAAVAEAFLDVPLLFNWLEGGKPPPLELERLKELGFRVLLFPVSTLLEATRSVRELLNRIRRADGGPGSVLEDRLLPFEEFTDMIGLPEIRELEERFADEGVRASS